MTDKIKILHYGRKFGQTMRHAERLAEIARGHTSVEISVMPSVDYQIAVDALNEIVNHHLFRWSHAAGIAARALDEIDGHEHKINTNID